MHCAYEDITSRIEEPPKWWDEYAVPRFCEFSPEETANIYAAEAALVQIACQSCGEKFAVAMTWGSSGMYFESGPICLSFSHYGDPPNAGCCAAGPTMQSDPVRVLEFWRKDEYRDWVRCKDLEKVVPE